MPDTVRCALIQTTGISPREAMVEHQAEMVAQRRRTRRQDHLPAGTGHRPVLLPGRDGRVVRPRRGRPGGTEHHGMMALAAELESCIILPLFEDDGGTYYNTAAVIDADGTYLGKYRKTHIPHGDHFYEKYYFKPGNLGFPVFRTRTPRSASTSATTGGSPRAPAPSGSPGPRSSSSRRRRPGDPTRRGTSSSAPTPSPTSTSSARTTGSARAVRPHDFYGHSYFCDPDGVILVRGRGDDEEVVLADLDLAQIRHGAVSTSRSGGTGGPRPTARWGP